MSGFQFGRTKIKGSGTGVATGPPEDILI